MPKGRHLKPDFFTDKNIVGMSPLARLLYQGLWCYAADCGHLDDEPIELKMRILPADNCDVDALLDEIAWHRRIIRKDGVIELPKLAEHQKPDKRYATMCDACKNADHDVTTPGTRSDHSVTTSGSHGGDEGPTSSGAATPTAQDVVPRSDHDVTTTGPQRDHAADGDGDGDGEVMVKSGRKRPARPIPDDWSPSEAHRRIAIEERVDCNREAQKFRDSAEAKDRRYSDWDAAFRNWLRSPFAAKVGPMPEVSDPSQLPPVAESWMQRRR